MSFTGLSDVIGNITGNNQSNLGALQQRGYAQYQAAPDPTLNPQAYAAYQAAQAQAAQINPAANQELGNQNALISQLQAQSQGTGPNLAQQQLQAGTQANLASQLAAAAGQRGNQAPGAERMQLANETAATNQSAAGQAAQLRGQQQLGAENALGSVLGQTAGQQIGLGENQAGLQNQVNLTNANAQNAASQFNTQSAQLGNQQTQSDYQFGQNLAAQQQSNQNAAIAGQQLAAQNATSQQTAGAIGGGLNAAGAAAGTAASSGGNGSQGSTQASFDQGAQATTNASSTAYNNSPNNGTQLSDNTGPDATGGVHSGTTHLVGEAGPEAIVRVPAHLGGIMDKLGKALAEGGIVPSRPPSGRDPASLEKYPSAGGRDPASLQAYPPSSSMHPGSMDLTNVKPPTQYASNTPSAPPAMAAGGVVPPETHVHIHSGQVLDHPEVGKVGDGKSAVAVVPLHGDGTPKTEAMKPAVQSLLTHPDFKAAVEKVVSKSHDKLASALRSAHG